MRIIKWRQFLKDGLLSDDKPASITIGVFDGVHLGHQALIKRIVSYNADAGYVPVIFTFRQNHKTKKLCDIQSFEERLAIFERLGVQITVAIDFSEEFRQMPGLDFLQLLLEHCRIGFFAVGSDFRCGYQLDTNASAIAGYFAAQKIPVEIVPLVCDEQLPVSSSRIRAAIAGGDILKAQTMLGNMSRLAN